MYAGADHKILGWLNLFYRGGFPLMVTIVDGSEFPGVHAGRAPGTGNGYVVGFTPVCELLRVDDEGCRAALVGLKYSHHSVTNTLVGPRPPTEDVKVTMLVGGGPWRQRVWREGTHEVVEYVLTELGDYVAWTQGLWHEWWPCAEATTMVTLSFRRPA